MKRVLIFFILFIASNLVQAQVDRIVISPEGDACVLLTIEGISDIYRFDPKKMSFTSYGFQLHDIKNDCFLGYPSFSPKGTLMAFSGECKSPQNGCIDKNSEAYYRLTIIDKSTKQTVIAFDHAENFSFSPDGTAIVYEEEIPGEPGTYTPKGYRGGLWLYDFKTKKEKNINRSSAHATEFIWTEHYNNICRTNYADVYCYNVTEEKMVKTNYHDIKFSPDEKYYYHASSETVIYQTDSNQVMTFWTNRLTQIKKQLSIYSWVLDGRALLVAKNQYLFMIFDLTKGEVVQEFQGGVLGRNPDGTKLLIHPAFINADGRTDINRDKVEIIDLNALPKEKPQ